MAGTAVLGRLTWQVAEVVRTQPETHRAASITFAVSGWQGHRPGQHVDVRLTADDGYQAARSYSIASSPAAGQLTITVERLDDGEVSPYLVDELRPGDAIELRGPIGGYFVWDKSVAAAGEPLLLVGGGSGIVPLMSMLRYRVETGSNAPVRLLYSSRSLDDVIYRAELDELASRPGIEVSHTLTRAQPPGWTGYARRIDARMLGEIAWPGSRSPRAYICGPTRLVEGVAAELVALGYDPSSVRTERFGPSGG
jgi:ferredoxin-NADP reductase